MNRTWLDEALDVAGLATARRFPRDLMLDLTMHLPVVIVVLPGATTHGVRKWLADHGLQIALGDTNRKLHGCLIAIAGRGIIFVDGDDSDAEQRFTLAHEIAHFILDHLLPRIRALRALGAGIEPVLNGERKPTQEEMLSAVLEQAPLGTQIHLMSRGPRGVISKWGIEESEQRADRLAIELIAPSQRALAALRREAHDADTPQARRNRAANCLAQQFGLPAHAAVAYADLLLQHGGHYRLSEELFGGRQE